jgi:hypothetical protein
METGESKLKETFEKLDKNPVFSFSKPYLDFIGKGKIFGLVYYVMAVISIILPFVVLYLAIDSGIFKLGAKYVFAIILSWFVILFACWIGFQLWWNRRTKVTDMASSEFIATVCFSDIFQTFGEWLGTMIGIIGVGVGLIASIFLGSEARYLFRALGLSSLGTGPLVIISGPIMGFFIIILFRFLAELARLFAVLVNNTREIATNIKNK